MVLLSLNQVQLNKIEDFTCVIGYDIGVGCNLFIFILRTVRPDNTKKIWKVCSRYKIFSFLWMINVWSLYSFHPTMFVCTYNIRPYLAGNPPPPFPPSTKYSWWKKHLTWDKLGKNRDRPFFKICPKKKWRDNLRPSNSMKCGSGCPLLAPTTTIIYFLVFSVYFFFFVPPPFYQPIRPRLLN